MGVEGTLEYLSDLLRSARKGTKKKKQIQTVALKVRMDCEGCVQKVKKVVSGVKGIRIFNFSITYIYIYSSHHDLHINFHNF